MTGASSFARHLHFIWLSDDEIPANRQACISSCIAAHPDWDFTIWRSLEQFGELRNQGVVDEAAQIAPPTPRGNPHQIVTNVLRFEIMLKHGGVFIDSDVVALRPIDELIERAEAQGKVGMLGWEIQDRWLGEAVIGCVPGAPFMEKIVANLQRWALARKGKPATQTVGPQYITPLLKGSRELGDVLVLPQETFFPARHDQPELGDAIIAGEVASPGTYLLHRFGNFRRRKDLVWT
jgi:mannosyltransferase OCH1-like enzyme